MESATLLTPAPYKNARTPPEGSIISAKVLRRACSSGPVPPSGLRDGDIHARIPRVRRPEARVLYERQKSLVVGIMVRF